jgi:hypothetical protein
MSIRLAALLAALIPLLAACSGSEPAPPPKAATESRAPTVLDPQLQALDKAKAVQATVDEQAEKTKKAIDADG